METLQGKRPLSTSDREHNKRASGVFLPKEADVSLGDKKGKFEELDRQAKKVKIVHRQIDPEKRADPKQGNKMVQAGMK